VNYLTWTPVGARLIEGWQGRYFLPLIVPVAVLLQWPASGQDKVHDRIQRAVAIGCLVFVELFLIYGFRVMYVESLSRIGASVARRVQLRGGAREPGANEVDGPLSASPLR